MTFTKLESENEDVSTYHSKHEIEGALPQYEGTFEDYNEVVLQVRGAPWSAAADECWSVLIGDCVRPCISSGWFDCPPEQSDRDPF